MQNKVKQGQIMGKTVFLDRDGTIIEEMGYINHFSRIRPLPKAVEAIKMFKKAGFKVIVVTNQSGVAKGYFSEQELINMNNYMVDQFAKQGAQIDALYYCPHHPQAVVPQYRLDCDCRKPGTGMILKAKQEHGVDLQRSWIIGDRESDIKLAETLNIHNAFVLTGYGVGEYVRFKGALKSNPEIICNDLLQAAQVIINYEKVEVKSLN